MHAVKKHAQIDGDATMQSKIRIHRRVEGLTEDIEHTINLTGTAWDV
jgi:hypothetical protein